MDSCQEHWGVSISWEGGPCPLCEAIAEIQRLGAKVAKLREMLTDSEGTAEQSEDLYTMVAEENEDLARRVDEAMSLLNEAVDGINGSEQIKVAAAMELLVGEQ